jgi:hypothetical protein
MDWGCSFFELVNSLLEEDFDQYADEDLHVHAALFFKFGSEVEKSIELTRGVTPQLGVSAPAPARHRRLQPHPLRLR